MSRSEKYECRRSTIQSLVSSEVWTLIDYRVMTYPSSTGVLINAGAIDGIDLSIHGYKPDDSVSIIKLDEMDNELYDSVLSYLCAEDDYIENCRDLTLKDLIEMLDASDAYVQIG